MRTDEIIPDSEGEEDLAPGLPSRLSDLERGPHMLQSAELLITMSLSSIQTANTTMRRMPSEMTAISNDTAPPRDPLPTTSSTILDTEASSDAPKPKPYPKPRPAWKGAKNSETNPSTDMKMPTTSSNLASSSNPESLPIAARPQSAIAGAKSDGAAAVSVHGGTTARLANPKDMNMDIDAIDIYSQDIAERAKMRSRARTGAKASPLSATADIIELSDDDEDELSFLRPNKSNNPKSRDSPRPKKRTKVSHTPTDTSNDAIIPLPPVSPLPPSDLPSTSTLPIASQSPTGPQTDTSRAAPSSPLPRPPKPPKRKRNVMIPDLNDDLNLMTAGSRDELDEAPLAPPTFFAGSSSMPLPPEEPSAPTLEAAAASDGTTKVKGSSASKKSKAAEQNSEAPSKKSKSRPKRITDDDDDWDAAIEEVAPSRGKKSKKNDEEDDWDGDAPKPKRKPAAKKKGKKDKGPTDGAEATSTTAKPSKRTKTGKDVQPKSNEFTVDSDQEHDLVPAAGPTGSDYAVGADFKDNGAEEANPGVVEVPSEEYHRSSPSPAKPLSSVPSAKSKKDKALASSPGASSKSRTKRRALLLSDDEEEEEHVTPNSKKDPDAVLSIKASEPQESSERLGAPPKENITPTDPSMPPPPATPSDASRAGSSYSISSRRKSIPMSELIRKVNSAPGSPFPAARPTYSPYAKSSKSLLKRIAPLHPNRKTPPPPPPRLPPPKKTKKQLEMEEKWEMELEESVEGWHCLSEEERAALRRAKRDMELGFED